MRRRGTGIGLAAIAVSLSLLSALGLAGAAMALPVGDFERFKQCPWTGAGVSKCFSSVTTGGMIVLGKKKVPIEKSITLQGGLSEPVADFSKFVAATNGVTLTKSPQPVPGGLLGLVPEGSSPYLVKSLIKFFIENSLTGVTSTLELAKPASAIRFSETHLAEEEGVALELPLKMRLENPFFSKRCYVGSEGSPIEWDLTSGATSPPAPNKPIEGSAGTTEFLGGGRILHLKDAKLVDNAWEGAKASGCGGVIAFLVDPIVNAQLSSMAAGYNSAELAGTIDIADAETVQLCADDNSKC